MIRKKLALPKYSLLVVGMIGLIALTMSNWRWFQSTDIAGQPTPTDDKLGFPRLIRGADPSIYWVEGETILHPIADWDTYLALGFDPNAFISVANDSLINFEIRPPLRRVVYDETTAQAYLLVRGKKIAIQTPTQWASLGFDPREVSRLASKSLDALPLSTAPFPDFYQPAHAQKPTIGIWWQGALCLAETTHMVCWPEDAPAPLSVPIANVSRLEIGEDDSLWIGTQTGEVWVWADVSTLEPVQVAQSDGWIAQILPPKPPAHERLWVLSVPYYDDAQGQLIEGLGVAEIVEGQSQSHAGIGVSAEMLTDIAYIDGEWWLGTHSAGVWRVNESLAHPIQYNRFNSTIGGNTIFDLELDGQGRLWASAPNRLSFWNVVKWETMSFTELFSGDEGFIALAASPVDDKMFLGGEYYLGYAVSDGSRTLFTAFEHPYFLDHFGAVVVDDQGNPWYIGKQRVLKWQLSTNTWQVLDRDTGQRFSFSLDQSMLTPVPDFPNPAEAYSRWLQTWPRPQFDNGRCIHYLQSPSMGILELKENIARLQILGIRWVVVNYTQRAQLLQMAPLFAEAGITVIWRPFVRPYAQYSFWAEDVAFLRSLGLPPYMQVYNEPEHPQEWDGQTPSFEIFLPHLIPAYREVYTAGGYVGLQFLDETWLKKTLVALKAEALPFDRLFYVSHAYGLNRPPSWDADRFGVLGFLADARILRAELGFVPPIIVGEGGWTIGNDVDKGFPSLTPEKHRDYHVEVFQWFTEGMLSNQTPLPDYLFAFCPWLLADHNHLGAWYDHPNGDLNLTLDAIQALSAVEQR